VRPARTDVAPGNYSEFKWSRAFLGEDQAMKRSRFSEEQIIGVLKEHEAGPKTADPLACPPGRCQLKS